MTATGGRHIHLAPHLIALLVGIILLLDGVKVYFQSHAVLQSSCTLMSGSFSLALASSASTSGAA